MRTRQAPRACALVLTLVALTACGSQYASNSEQDGRAVQPEALRIELDAQMRDACFRVPTEVDPPDCKKYITQLASTPKAARELATDFPRLASAADELSDGIGTYRDKTCGATAGAPDEACGQALRTISDAVDTMYGALS